MTRDRLFNIGLLAMAVWLCGCECLLMWLEERFFSGLIAWALFAGVLLLIYSGVIKVRPMGFLWLIPLALFATVELGDLWVTVIPSVDTDIWTVSHPLSKAVVIGEPFGVLAILLAVLLVAVVTSGKTEISV